MRTVPHPADSPARTVAARLAPRVAVGPRPYLIGVCGGVAAGKSVFADALAQALGDAEVVSLDGFLFPGVTVAKGFPESFDRDALGRFAADLRAGRGGAAPVYSHATYDIVPGALQRVAGTGVVILEGVIALDPVLRPHLDCGVFLEADEATLEGWYLARRAALRGDGPEERARGERLWRDVNLPNLRGPIAAGRARADLIVRLRPDHGLDTLEERWTS